MLERMFHFQSVRNVMTLLRLLDVSSSSLLWQIFYYAYNYDEAEWGLNIVKERVYFINLLSVIDVVFIYPQ
jgi:hypothetical protein